MEYPGSIFTKPLRRLLFISFIVVFFIVAPLVILYTAGYRYDWKNGLLRETGSLSIDVEPATVSAYLNGVKLSGKAPYRVKNVTPGKYTLLLSASGFYDWQKEIEIKNKQTTYIKEFRLLKKTKPELLLEGNYSNASLSPDGQSLLFEEDTSSTRTVMMLNTQNSSTTSIDLPKNSKSWFVSWAEKNNYATISDALENPSHLYVVHTSDSNVDRKEITQEIPEPIVKWMWRSSAEPTLFLSTKTRIYSYQASTGQLTPLATNQFIDWYEMNDELWSVSATTTEGAYRITRDVLGFPSLYASLIPQTASHGVSTSLKILTILNEGVLVQLTNDSNLWLVTPLKTFKLPTTALHVSTYNNWLLSWSRSELWTYAQNEEPNLLSRVSEAIKTVRPLDKYNTLAVVQPTKTWVLYPYYFISHDFINGEVTSFAPDTVRYVGYFTGLIGSKKGLWRINY